MLRLESLNGNFGLFHQSVAGSKNTSCGLS